MLAGARPAAAQRIPLEPFLRLLRSGGWADHNKASLLLANLTRNREPRVLAALRAEALEPLLEMAKWRSPGHAFAALEILGRIAGIEEDALMKMLEDGEANAILAKFDAR